MSYWRGKRALIVGGSAGLGRALADVLAEHGARLSIVARRQQPLDDAAAALKTRGAEVLSIAADVTKTDELKRVHDALISAWGGIAGVQSTVPVLLDRGYHDRGLPLERIAELIAAGPARRFRIARKGTIEQGNDADLVLIDAAGSFTLETDHLQQRHKASPYVGATFHGTVRATLRRGETIFRDGQVTACSSGRFVRPEHVR